MIPLPVKPSAMEFLQILAFLSCVLIINCYNVNVRNVFIYSKPRDNLSGRGSYFGFSVILQKKWVQVGAPRGNSTFFGEKITEPGVVYRCKLNEGECRELILDYWAYPDRQRQSIKSVRDNKDYAWIGGSMDMEGREDGKLVVCGHRWKNRINPARKYSDAITGLCYSSKYYTDIFNQTFELLLPRDLYQPSPYEAVTYLGILRDSQFGMSISLNQESEDRLSLLIGAPGAGSYWSGGAVHFEAGVSSQAIARRKRATGKTFDDFKKQGFIYEGTSRSSFKFEQFSYFGYQVTSGFFFDSKLSYAVSSPRGADLRGYVLIYSVSFYRSEIPTLVVHDKIEGWTTGEYFGASLVAADVNGDSHDELVVGAPLFSQRGGDEGCIYVFSSYSGTKLQETDKKVGFQLGGRFGTSLGSLGDIDQDGYKDIAVGCPYEGNGVIYIYNGSPEGLKLTQKIEASKIDLSLKGFGISISRPTDVDENYYKDFVVGSYLSENVVLFRTHPTIELNATLNGVSELQVNDTKFEVKACVKYVGKNAPRNVVIIKSLEVDVDFHRFESIPDEILTLPVSDKENCSYLTIKKKIKLADMTIDGLEDVKIILSMQLYRKEERELNVIWKNNLTAKSGSDKFCKFCPVLRKSNPAIISIPYSRKCKGGECISDVQLNCELYQDSVSFRTMHNTYIIGSKPVITLSMTIYNDGDTLYSGGIEIKIPREVNLAKIPFMCEESRHNNSLSVYCKLGAITDKLTKTINIGLDLSDFKNLRSLSEKGHHLSFKVSTLYPKNHKDSYQNNNYCDLKLKLKMDTRISISGKPDKEWYAYENEAIDSEKPKVEPTIVHTYEVSNIGISPIHEVQAIVYVPVEWDKHGSKFDFTTLSVQAFQNSKSVLCSSLEGRIWKENFGIRDDGVDVMKELKIKAGNISENHPVNRTFFLNCSSSYVNCEQFICSFSELMSDTHVKVVIGTTLNVSLLEPVMERRDIIYFSTYGEVKIIGGETALIEGDNVHHYIVSSPVIGSVPSEKVAIWIIIVCIIAGILLILIVVVSLMKAGFFKREKKEELVALKQSQKTASE